MKYIQCHYGQWIRRRQSEYIILYTHYPLVAVNGIFRKYIQRQALSESPERFSHHIQIRIKIVRKKLVWDLVQTVYSTGERRSNRDNC